MMTVGLVVRDWKLRRLLRQRVRFTSSVNSKLLFLDKLCSSQIFKLGIVFSQMSQT